MTAADAHALGVAIVRGLVALVVLVSLVIFALGVFVGWLLWA